MTTVSHKNICDLLKIIDNETLHSESKWLELGRILYGLSKLIILPSQKTMLQLWINISMFDDYDNDSTIDDCNYHWENWKQGRSLRSDTIDNHFKSLNEFVKKSNPNGYSMWEQNIGLTMNMPKTQVEINNRDIFNRFKADCITKQYVLNKAVTLDEIYKCYMSWKIPKNTKLHRADINTFMVEDFGDISYCDIIFDFGWKYIAINKDKRESLGHLEGVSMFEPEQTSTLPQTNVEIDNLFKPLFPKDVIEDIKRPKVSFDLPIKKRYKSIFDFVEPLYDSEPEPIPEPIPEPMPEPMPEPVEETAKLENGLDIDIIQNNNNHPGWIDTELNIDDSWYNINPLSPLDLVAGGKGLSYDDLTCDTEPGEIVSEDNTDKMVNRNEPNTSTRVNDSDDSAEYLKEEDYINIEPPVNKKRRRKLKLKHNSVDKQIETFFKTAIEKCDDGYISLDYLKDDFAKYCFYKGVPKDRHFIELVNEKLGRPQKIYVDGQKFTHLIWGYKFKPVEYDV